VTEAAYIVTDLGYGDCGKGTIVDALARRSPKPPVVIRHNGGPQAAHNVVLLDGRSHTFSQFGSATFVPDALTYLSAYCLVNPLNMAAEEKHLRTLGITDAYQRLFVSHDAPIITPYHKAMNRIMELARGANRHGSCGQGIGVTMNDYKKYQSMSIRAGDCVNMVKLRDKLEFWRGIKLVEASHGQLAAVDSVEKQVFHDDDLIDHLVDYYAWWGTIVTITLGQPTMFNAPMIFEGAQGVLLDEWFGFHPYTTWSTTTTLNARRILDRCHWGGYTHSIGVIRAYQTRHGPGPFVTEGTDDYVLPEPHNGTGVWQGDFRTGWLDLVATRYALEVSGGIDCLAITHLDTVDGVEDLPVCEVYKERQNLAPNFAGHDLGYQRMLTRTCTDSTPLYTTVDKVNRAKTIAGMLKLPLLIESWGPTYLDKIFH
jgi:adenylosuccinate synthase